MVEMAFKIALEANLKRISSKARNTDDDQGQLESSLFGHGLMARYFKMTQRREAKSTPGAVREMQYAVSLQSTSISSHSHMPLGNHLHGRGSKLSTAR